MGSSPCRREEMSRVSSSVLLVVSRLSETLSRLNAARTLLFLSNMDSSTLAPPILELVCVPLFTLTFLAGPRNLFDKLKARCEELAVQPRGTRGESGGQTGCTYDI